MKKLVALSAILALGCIHQAHATTVDITLGNAGTYNFSNSSSSTTPNVVISSSTVDLEHEALVINSSPFSVLNDYVQPTVNLLSGGSYLAVEGTAGDHGHALFSLAGGDNNFGFDWGSIDTFNTLKVTVDNNGTFHNYFISGTSLLNDLGLLSEASNATTQTSVDIYDPSGNIVSAQFITSQNSFEAANFSEFHSGGSTVPLPPSALLFMLSVLTLGFVAYRKQKQKI